MKKGIICTEMPRRKDGKIDWLLTCGMNIEIKSFEYGIKRFKIMDVYRDGKLTFLSIIYDNKYVGDIDCSLIYNGNIGVLIGEIPSTRYKKYYYFNPKYKEECN